MHIIIPTFSHFGSYGKQPYCPDFLPLRPGRGVWPAPLLLLPLLLLPFDGDLRFKPLGVSFEPPGERGVRGVPP